MKISKRQLKRIIREEKRRLQEYGRPTDAMIRARNEEPSPEEMKYQSQWHGDKINPKAEDNLEAAVYELLGNLTGAMGLSHDEAAEMILKSVEDILGM